MTVSIIIIIAHLNLPSRNWTISTYKCSRQSLYEKLGKTSRTVDSELESQIEVIFHQLYHRGHHHHQLYHRRHAWKDLVVDGDD